MISWSSSIRLPRRMKTFMNFLSMVLHRKDYFNMKKMPALKSSRKITILLRWSLNNKILWWFHSKNNRKRILKNSIQISTQQKKWRLQRNRAKVATAKSRIAWKSIAIALKLGKSVQMTAPALDAKTYWLLNSTLSK